MKKLLPFVFAILICNSYQSSAQFGKMFAKKEKTEKSANDSIKKPTEDEKVKKGSGGGFMQKMITKIAKNAGKIGGMGSEIMKSTDDLSAIDPLISINSNLYSKEIGTADMDFFSGWMQGGDMVMVMLLPKDKLGFYSLKGDMKIDGEKPDNNGMGLYSRIYAGTKKPKIVELNTKSGQAKFSLVPLNHYVKIASINNKKENCEIDMSKDFTIQLENISTKPDATISISVVGVVALGFRTVLSAGTFKASSNIKIPGYALKHINTDGDAGFKNTYLIVTESETKTAIDEAGFYKTPVEYIACASDAKSVNVLNPVAVFNGFTSKGEEKMKLGKLNYEFKKGNAFRSRPSEQIKNIVPSVFAIRGTTAMYSQKDNKWTNVQTTKTINFTIPENKLDEILLNLYTQTTTIIKEQFNANILSPELITNSKTYKDKSIYNNQDEVGESDFFSKSYKGLAPVAKIAPLASVLRGDSAMLKEIGESALLKVTLDIRVSYENSPLAIPTLNIELVGKENGSSTSTTYFTGAISGEGYAIPSKAKDMNYDNIVRIDDMMLLLKKALQDLSAKEKQNNEYIPLWKLKV